MGPGAGGSFDLGGWRIGAGQSIASVSYEPSTFIEWDRDKGLKGRVYIHDYILRSTADLASPSGSFQIVSGSYYVLHWTKPKVTGLTLQPVQAESPIAANTTTASKIEMVSSLDQKTLSCPHHPGTPPKSSSSHAHAHHNEQNLHRHPQTAPNNPLPARRRKER